METTTLPPRRRGFDEVVVTPQTFLGWRRSAKGLLRRVEGTDEMLIVLVAGKGYGWQASSRGYTLRGPCLPTEAEAVAQAPDGLARLRAMLEPA